MCADHDGVWDYAQHIHANVFHGMSNQLATAASIVATLILLPVCALELAHRLSLGGQQRRKHPAQRVRACAAFATYADVGLLEPQLNHLLTGSSQPGGALCHLCSHIMFLLGRATVHPRSMPEALYTGQLAFVPHPLNGDSNPEKLLFCDIMAWVEHQSMWLHLLLLSTPGHIWREKGWGTHLSPLNDW